MYNISEKSSIAITIPLNVSSKSVYKNENVNKHGDIEFNIHKMLDWRIFFNRITKVHTHFEFLSAKDENFHF